MQKVFFCFLLSIALRASAQEDSLIVLNKDVRISWRCSRLVQSNGKMHLQAKLNFYNESTFRSMYTAQHRPTTVTGPCNDCGLKKCHCISFYPSDGESIDNPPKIFLKYTKQKMAYAVEIPLKKLRRTKMEYHHRELIIPVDTTKRKSKD